MRRRGLIGAAALLAQARAAHAQGSGAARPIRLISPFNPGGATDVLSRLLADRMASILGQPVVVDARPGANTVLGAEATARAAPDGLTFMVTTNSTHTSNPFLYRGLPYDAEASFAPVMLISIGSVLLAAPQDRGFGDLAGFLAWGRAQGRPIGYGSWGVGSLGHLAGALLARRSGLAMDHVPFRGEQPALTEVVTGRLDSSFASPVGALPLVRADRLRALGMVGARRSAGMPEVPTFGEQGFEGFDVTPFVAAWAPAATPREAIERLNAALAAAIADPEIRQRMLDQGQEPVASSPEELSATLRRETPRWRALIEASGARLE